MTRGTGRSRRGSHQRTKAPEEPAHEEGPTLGAGTLQDLMLQAEILVQYGMRNKAVERLQRIQELFPREEERNEDLQRLYMSAGVTPRYAGAAPLPPAAAPGPAAPVRLVPAPVRRLSGSRDGCAGVSRGWRKFRGSCITREQPRRC